MAPPELHRSEVRRGDGGGEQPEDGVLAAKLGSVVNILGMDFILLA